MGSIISKILDDYKSYERLCEIVGEESISDRRNFYLHEKQLMEKHGYELDGLRYVKTKKTIRKEKINKII